MYLEGYKIIYEKEKIITLPKWDFGGDKSYTNSYWHKILSNLRSLTTNDYPLYIYDLDNVDAASIRIKTTEEFENWLRNDFNKSKFDQS